MSLYVYGQDELEGPGVPQFDDESIIEDFPGLIPSPGEIQEETAVQEFEGRDPAGYVHIDFAVDAEELSSRGPQDLPVAGTFPIYPAGDGFAIPLEGSAGNVTGATMDMAAAAFLDTVTADERVLQITDFSVERL